MKPAYSILAILVLIYGTGSIECQYSDARKAAGNTFTAFSSTGWTQTSQADFQSDSTYQVVITSAGRVTLAMESSSRYYATGWIRTQVFDTGKKGTGIDLVAWSETLQSGTDITLYIRASDYPFAAGNTTLAWTSRSTSPISAGLPSGRYIQWRADLSANSNRKNTPALEDVTVWYH